MNTDTREILLDYLKTPETERRSISPSQADKLRRIISLTSLLEQHRLDRDAILIYINLESARGNSISQAQAYRDLNDAKYIQGEINEIHKQFERVALANWQKEIMQKSVELNDMRSFNQGMANLIKIMRLDHPDEAPIDYDKLQPVLAVFGFHPDLFTHNELPNDKELKKKIDELRNPKKYLETAEYVDYRETVSGAANKKGSS